MVEKMIFDMSGLVKDKNDKKEIEFWGHDAGEFVYEEIEKILQADDSGKLNEGSEKIDN